MGTTSVKITCTDTVQKTRVNEFVYESFGQFDGLNKVWKYTERSFAFPDQEIIKNLRGYVDSAPVQCIDFIFVMEFDSAANLVEVYCTSTGGAGTYKPVKLFSGKFLK